MDPTSRFTGLADVYARSRPDYPKDALDFIVAHCRLGAGAIVVDVGCGTGISSRLLAERGLRVIGIEPNADMRQRAAGERGAGNAEYRAGRAEATGLPDTCADAVVAAQSAHWFKLDAAFAEFHRILKPGGWVVLIWNERDETDVFTAAYGDVIRSTPGAAALEAMRQAAGEPLLTCPLFAEAQRTVFAHAQVLDEAGMIGRALSVSYAPREPADIERYKSALQAVFARFQQEGQVVLRYCTTVYAGQRANGSSAA